MFFQLSYDRLDERFSYKLFGVQPLWLIRQGTKHGLQKRNLDQLSTARLSQLFANANRGKDTPAFDDTSMFLPHSGVWMEFNKTTKYKFSQKVAREVLQSLDSLDVWVKIALDDCLSDLASAAHQ